jgi:hypothetical protein
MVKSEETVELVEKTVHRVLRKSNSHLSQLLGIAIATCKTLRQNLSDVISLHSYMNILYHVIYTNLRKWAHVHHMSHVLFSDTIAPSYWVATVCKSLFRFPVYLCFTHQHCHKCNTDCMISKFILKNKVLQNTYDSSSGS